MAQGDDEAGKVRRQGRGAGAFGLLRILGLGFTLVRSGSFFLRLGGILWADSWCAQLAGFIENPLVFQL
jgi:hypothetical protein